MTVRMLAAAIAAALPFAAAAQQAQQKIRPPIAVYWMSVETAGGMAMGMGGLPPGMAGMLPPGVAGGGTARFARCGSSRVPA